MSGAIPYRPEIDGLRAVAVLSVVFYHAGLFSGGPLWIGGGFVGVDIFFVISGFLIGGILWRDIRETGRIRLARFYCAAYGGWPRPISRWWRWCWSWAG